MKNAAGDKDCDLYLRKELEIAEIEIIEWPLKPKGVVPTQIKGYLNGWWFERLWHYWTAKTESNPLFFKYAEPLHEKYGKDVRVDGHCGCPGPREWFVDSLKQPWAIGVNHYHIDSEWGLKALADAIRNQAVERLGG